MLLRKIAYWEMERSYSIFCAPGSAFEILNSEFRVLDSLCLCLYTGETSLISEGHFESDAACSAATFPVSALSSSPSIFSFSRRIFAPRSRVSL